ncbi:hypothetical protein Daesc_005362 [Daldinia eschscholtzii]|uniref:Epoxide hydrolase N-terminal domain-containing protein n=1 Tax=Daldinia eschscholtzii TaxID=292717 RepID=A0AAX6MKT6_9PEZI
MSPSDAIEPFRIAVPDQAIETLKAKLALATFPRETTFSNDSNYGARVDDIKRLATAWRDTFDWREAEAKLNDTLPQFTTRIGVDGHEDDLKIHFVHAKSEREDAIPLLFCHGWPGSFLEVSKILPLLTTGGGEDEPAFHVVAPSIPNFGFSQGTSKPGFGIRQHAEVCHKLMLRLGYNKYVTQGGDWGYVITRRMGELYPTHVQASHINFIYAFPPTLLSSPLLYLQHRLGLYSASEKAGLERTRWFAENGSGYRHIQGTKPHTPGFALVDSPVALLAWIYEKLVDWTDAYPWTDEEVLTWIAIYAFSEAGPDASLRLYYETVHNSKDALFASGWIGKVPLGLSYFPRDLTVVPSSWGRTLGPVVFEKRHEDGGHFAAFERPEKLAADLRTMLGKKSGIGAKLSF